jgi:cyanophycinase
MVMSRLRMAFWILLGVIAGPCWFPLPGAVAGEGRSGKDGAGKEPAGTLLIIGGGRTPNAAVTRALELAGGPSARVLVIPFAWGREATGRISVRMWQQAGAEHVTVLPWDSERSEALREVRAADVIWFGGGSQNVLMDRLTRLDLVEAIRERHRKGAVVGGTSAGAAVMSAVMLTGSRTPGRTEAAGLGLWPQVIVDQHYLARQRRPRLLEALKEHPRLVGVGIDEGTAVLVRGRGGRFEVLGYSQVEVLVPPSRGREVAEVATFRLGADAVFDLPR